MSPVRNHPELVGETAALGQSSSAEQADARPADAALLGRLQNRDEEAANEVFQRYVRRLTALARSRLSASMAARFDADDVVMSAYRSFFIRAREGQFALEAGGDLWRLLVEITLHKLYRKSAHHQAQKRSTTRETAQRDGEPVAAAPEPTPDVALAMAEELAMAMQEMPGEARSALELRLKGHELREIAEELNCSERTVRRWLDDARAVLRRRFPEVDRTLAATQTQRGRRATTVRRRTKSPRRQRMARPLPQAPIEHLEFSDYLLRRQLGAGATGKVFLATDKRHARDVAVKFLRKLFLRDADVRARFVAEAGLIAALDHPGLVKLYGLGPTPNGGLFIVLDYLHGGDLQARCQIRLPTDDQIERWLAQAALAIEHAHKRGVVHCDLKPANLLLDADDNVVVTDFGLARLLLADRDPEESIAGTPAFMAPEQLEPSWGPVGPTTDVYGLGATLYSLLAGRAPRSGPAAAMVLELTAGVPVPRLTGCDPRLADVCARALSADPTARFATAADFANALRLGPSDAAKPSA